MSNSKSLITLGTPTSTGGKVIFASSDIVINGQKVALIGDIATCCCGSQSCKGQGPIVKGFARDAVSGGVEFACEQDEVLTGCGNCFLLASSHDVKLGGMMGRNVSIGGNVSIGNGVRINTSAVTINNSRMADHHSPTTFTSSTSGVNSSVTNTSGASARQMTMGLSDVIPPYRIEKTNPTSDVDTTYIMFSDTEMSLDEFSEQAYLSTKPEVLEHIKKTNAHLIQTNYRIIKGMPVVISPWSKHDPDESLAVSQVNELAALLLTLTPEQQAWFADNNEEFTNTLVTASLVPGASLYDLDGDNVQEINISNNMLAALGAGIAGAQVQADRISSRVQEFSRYSQAIGELTKHMTNKQMMNLPEYHQWRREARLFQQDIQTISKQFGTPRYLKNLQVDKVNKLLGSGKKQLYRAKDFSNLASGINLTPLYKQSMKFSQYLGRAGWLAFSVGVKDNIKDIYVTCSTNGMLSEACARAEVRNGSSIVFNGLVGAGIGRVGMFFSASTFGLSIIPTIVGEYYWGLYGGEISDWVGEQVEDGTFKLVDFFGG